MNAQDLRNAGTSIWLDDLSRRKLTGADNHSLPHRISEDGVVGVTTNPSIFLLAIKGSADYAAEISKMQGKSPEEIVRKLTTDDVRSACDLFAPIHLASHGIDGRVSIEVDPRFAHNTEATVEEGKLLYEIVDRKNVLIKVPATLEGLPAITALIAQGISVNVTLIFSLARYADVIDAFMSGLEDRLQLGFTIDEIHSVASFFISRIDTAVDAALRDLGNTDLLGKAAIANARLAYELYEEKFASDRWKKLQGEGAHAQRPLWASTGVKDPNYDDTRYVLELVAPHTVNTMPQSTLDAVLDHGVFKGNTIQGRYEEARADILALHSLGISIDEISHELEVDGVKKFADGWITLLESVKTVHPQ
jgi:transaldolase